MQTNFSFHAYARVFDRISLSHQELAHILDAEKAFNIGQENKSNRVHKLFYSEKDDICFVAVQDIKTGTVITVLPIDYHENIAWKISLASQNIAKQMILGKPEDAQTDQHQTQDQDGCEHQSQSQHNSPSQNICRDPQEEPKQNNASVFKISGYVVNQYQEYQKVINIGSWPCLPYQHSIDLLVEDHEFLDFLVEKTTKKLLSMESGFFVRTIAIRVGSKGEPVLFSTSEMITSDLAY